jgi:hypothetical protein
MYKAGQKRMNQDLQNSGDALERKFWIAISLYGVLAILAWFTIGAGSIDVHGRQVPIRLIPLFILGVLALRTVLGRHADRIRNEKQEGQQ